MKDIIISLFVTSFIIATPCKAISAGIHSVLQERPASFAFCANTTNTPNNSVEIFPEFPGGTEVLLRYIADHIKYPEASQRKGVQGICMVRFMVNKKGIVKKATVSRHLDDDCDREAIRVIKSLPRFVPGREEGKPINTWLTIPIIFQLKH